MGLRRHKDECIRYKFSFSVAQNPKWGLFRLNVNVRRSHADTHTHTHTHTHTVGLL